MSMFKRAERRKVFLKLGVMGPSGSGKTYSALLLAKGLAKGGKIAAIDTENGSLSLYSHLVDVDVLTMGAPFEPKRAIEAILYAANNGYSVLIIDSMSHFWRWLLEYKESIDKSGGNSFTNWAKVKPYFEALKQTMLQAKIHIICCTRSKDEYVIEKNDRGKDAPKKIGMGAIMEPGSEYEYTTVFEIGMDHNATASKDRTALFDGEFFKISATTGQRFLDWLESGAGELVDDEGVIDASYTTAETEKALSLDQKQLDSRVTKRNTILREWTDLSPTQITDLSSAVKGLGLNPTDTIIAAHEAGAKNGEDFYKWLEVHRKPNEIEMGEVI